MRDEHVKFKKLIIPILTLALLLGSWAPKDEVRQVVNESKFGGTAIVEIYKGARVAYAAQAAKVNWDTIAKSYNVKVYVDGKDNEIQFTQSTGKPFIAKDRTFVPYRVMSEALGAKVDWDGDIKKVTAEGNGNKVELLIGHSRYKVNGINKTMDVEPFILSAESRTYIPARYLTEGLDYTIDFAKDGQIMFICSFTKGQNEVQRKAILDEIIQADKNQEKPATPQTSEWLTMVDGEPRFIIKDGKLSAEQVQLVKGILNAGEDPFPWMEMPKLEWVSPDEVYNHDAYVKEMKRKWGGNTIIDDRLILKNDCVFIYYVVGADGKLWRANVRTYMDGTVDVGRGPYSDMLELVM